MKILACEPFYRGSHKQFLDEFSFYSQHDWHIHGLPGRNWRWRMRHAPLTFHQELVNPIEADLLFCSSMFNLTEFIGLRPEASSIPSVLYFHENQLTYPLPEGVPRDYHTVYIQFMSCISATEIWFNSAFHQTEFFTALKQWLKRMPDYSQANLVPSLKEKSRIAPPPIESRDPKEQTSKESPLHLLWVARLEQDKNFTALHQLIQKLADEDLPFEISVLGKMSGKSDTEEETFRQSFKNRIRHWGYQENREDYFNVLEEADLILSTADHEFFGLAVAEAVQAGCYPLLPNRLAYPEIYKAADNPKFFYNDENDLWQKLRSILKESGNNLYSQSKSARDQIERYTWANRIERYDEFLQSLVSSNQSIK